MNFEVFQSLEEQEIRAAELRAAGHIVIPDYNGRVFTIKWKEQ